MAQTQSLLDARYGASAPEIPEELSNPVLESLLKHRSIRAFQEKPLAKGILPLLVAAAQSAPSTSNIQPWSVLVVEDAERRAQIAELSGGQPHIRQAPVFLVWLLDFARLRRIAQRHGASAAGLSSHGIFQFGAGDTLVAAQNTLVAAESLGLGTVYIGAFRRRTEELWSLLGLPEEVLPVVGLAVGYPDADKPSAIKPRLPQHVVAHYERYDEALLESDLEDYNLRLQNYFSALGQPAQEWTRQTSERVSSPDTFFEHLKRLGFNIG